MQVLVHREFTNYNVEANSDYLVLLNLFLCYVPAFLPSLVAHRTHSLDSLGGLVFSIIIIKTEFWVSGYKL